MNHILLCTTRCSAESLSLDLHQNLCFTNLKYRIWHHQSDALFIRTACQRMSFDIELPKLVQSAHASYQTGTVRINFIPLMQRNYMDQLNGPILSRSYNSLYIKEQQIQLQLGKLKHTTTQLRPKHKRAIKGPKYTTYKTSNPPRPRTSALFL
jgi:hypothetical protein